ncbi:MAG: hypothetical protein ACI9DG_001639 [Oleispira sp.]|jgi:hypothetical protein
MRILLALIIGFCFIPLSFADNVLTPITDLSEFAVDRGSSKIIWNNERPEQQRALKQFYRAMDSSAPRPSIERQQHAQELRGMSPQQRQQLFLNYIQKK